MFLIILCSLVNVASCFYAGNLGYISVFESGLHASLSGMGDCVQFAFKPEERWCFSENEPDLEAAGLVFVNRDEWVKTTSCQLEAPWHLLRLQSRNLQSFGNYSDSDGSEPIIYIVDTYMQTDHPDFKGRASLGFRIIDDGNTQSHGTHVGGLAGGFTYGASKNSRIVSVQVLNSAGYGQWSDILRGLSYISQREMYNSRTNVVNISISGPYSYVTNLAVNRLVQQGLFIVVAAGNDGHDACANSPASAELVMTVAASNKQDKFSTFSNYGRCVDIVAPGESIQSLIPKGRTGYMSGTSMAAPLVAGLAATYLSKSEFEQISPADLKTIMKIQATKERLTQIPRETKNLIAYAQNNGQCGFVKKSFDLQV